MCCDVERHVDERTIFLHVTILFVLLVSRYRYPDIVGSTTVRTITIDRHTVGIRIKFLAGVHLRSVRYRTCRCAGRFVVVEEANLIHLRVVHLHVDGSTVRVFNLSHVFSLGSLQLVGECRVVVEVHEVNLVVAFRRNDADSYCIVEVDVAYILSNCCWFWTCRNGDGCRLTGSSSVIGCHLTCSVNGNRCCATGLLVCEGEIVVVVYVSISILSEG